MVTVDSKVPTSKIIHCVSKPEFFVFKELKAPPTPTKLRYSWTDLFNQNGWIQFGSSKELTKYDDSKTPCSIKIVLLRRKPYFSVTSVTPCSVWLLQLQLVLSIKPLILRDFIKIIRYTGECSIFSAYQRLCKATQTFEICTWYCILEKLSF